MKAKLVAVLCAGVAMVVQADVVYNNPGYKWLTSDGYWNVAANWEEGHQPTSFQAAIFDKGATVRIPAATADAPFTEGSLFYPRVGNFPYGDKLTIDGSGTYWLKKVNPADSFNRSYLCLADFGGYFWGGEGMNANKADDDWYWYATNLVMTVERGPSAAEDGATLTLKQGFLNLYDPLGRSDHDHTFNLFHSGRANLSVIYEEGTHTRTRAFGNRANGENSLFWIKGGLHEFFNNFSGKSYTSAYPGLTRISGGVVDVKTGWAMPQQANGPADGSYDVVGRIRVDGTGEFRHTDGDFLYVGWGGAHTKSYFEMDENAVARVGHIYMGGQANTWGSFEMTGNSRLEAYDNNRILIVGRETGSVASFKMDGNATASLGQVRVGAEDNNNRSDAFGRISLAGNSRMTVGNSLYVARASCSTGIVEVAGNAVLSLLNGTLSTCDVGGMTNAVAHIEVSENGGLEHGHVYLCNVAGNSADIVFGGHATNHVWQDNMGYQFVVGRSSNSVARATFKDDARVHLPQVYVGSEDNNQAKRTVKGVMTVEDNAYVSIGNHLRLGNVNLADALLEVKGGTLDLNNTQILVGNQPDATSRVQVTGGTVKAGLVLLGCANDGSGSSFEMTGGEMTAAGNLVIGNNAGSDAEAHFGGTAKYEQTGGCILVASGDNATGRLLIDGNAEVTAQVWLGNVSAATKSPTVDIKGNGTLNWEGNCWLGLAPGHSLMTISENGTLNLAGNVNMGWSGKDGERPELVLKDNGRITGAGTIGVGNNASSAATLRIEGGSIDALTGLALQTGGTNSLIEISGGDHRLYQIFAYQNNNFGAATTNTVRFSGGKTVSSNWHVIGNNGQVGRVEISGGEFLTREVRLGFGNQVNLLSTMNISGGTLTVQDVTAANPNADCRFYFGSGTGNSSRGHLEMTGGEIRTMAMMSSHSAEGRSSARFDGGAIVQILRSHPSDALIQGLTLAEVGETGLTIRPNGFDSWINQEFTDVEGRDGAVTVAGSGSLRVAKNSTHARTVVDGGTLLYGAGVDTFGRRIELKNGGTVSIAGDRTSFSCEKLVMNGGVLKFDSGDRIVITGEDGLEISGGILDVSHISKKGTYDLFTVADGASIDPAKVAGLRLRTPNPFLSYTVNANGQLEVKDRVFADAIWAGSSASWSTASNWDPETLPTADARATFGAAGVKTVTVDAAANAGVLSFTAAGYEIGGSGTIALDAAVEAKVQGTTTVAAPVSFNNDVAMLTGVEGAEVELAGPLSTAADTTLVSKSGSAKVTVSGDNAGFDAAWQVSGGTLGFVGPTAFGSGDRTVELASGTLAYSGDEAGTMSGKLLLKAPAGIGVIVDTAEDLTVTNVELSSGRLVKKGVGSLKFDLDQGKYVLADTTDRLDNPGDEILLPASGDSPTSVNMFNSLTILEGALVVEGKGSNETKVVHYNGVGLGEPYTGARTNAQLVLKNVYFDNQIDAYLSVGRRHLSSEFNEPTVQVLDGAHLQTQRICLGWGANVQTSCGLAVTNGSVYCGDHLLLGEGVYGKGVLRVGPGGKISVWNRIEMRQQLDVLVAGKGAEIRTLNNNGRDDRYTWDGMLEFSQNQTRGTMTFKDGGSLTLSAHIHANNYSTDGTANNPGVKMVFDGGSLNFLNGGTSMMTRPQYQGLYTEGDGLTLSVAENAIHTLTIPIRGDGKFVKTGKGELVFADVRDMTSAPSKTGADGVNYFDYQYNKTDIVLGQYAGETVVREGKLTLAKGMLPETAKVRVEADGTLDLGGNSFAFASAEGAGTIANGSLTTTFKAAKGGDAVRFENVALGNCKVDLPSDAQPGDAFTFAQLGEGTTATPENWKAYVDGKHVRAAFAKDGEGRITVTRQKPLGLSILVR